MKKFSLFLLCIGALTSVYTQHSSLSIFAPSSAFCTSDVNFRVTVTNVDVDDDPLPLTNTAVFLRMWNEEEDTNTENPFYTLLQNGPDIASAANHVFNMTIPAKTIVAAGKYQVKILFVADIDGNDMSDNPIFEISYSFCGISQSDARERLIAHANANPISETQAIYIYPSILNTGTSVSSLYSPEFTDTLESGQYFAFVQSNPFATFGQPCQYLFLDPFTQSVQSHNVNWWPVVNDEEYAPEINGPDLGTIIDWGEGGLEEIIFNGEATPNETKSCAILVSGHEWNATFSHVLPLAVESYKQNLIRNPFGPQLNENQIITLVNKPKDEVKLEIEKVQQGYDCIYFYYVGHGSRKDKGAGICLTADAAQWYRHLDLAEDLLSSEASKIRIIVDCCFAGQIIDAVRDNPKSEGKDIQILTSSTTDKYGRYLPYEKDGMDIDALWVYSHYLNAFSGDPSSDFNGDGEVSFAEINKQILQNDPYYRPTEESFVELTCPQLYGQIGMEQVRDIIKSIAEVTENTLGDDQVVMVHPQLMESNTKIESFNPNELNITLTKPAYVGWSISNPYSDFEQPSKLFLLDPETQETDVFDLSWWVKINGEDWFPNLAGPESLNPVQSVDLPQLPELDIINPYDNPKICALLINGNDATPWKTKIFEEDVSSMKRNLQYNTYGPRLPDAQIITRTGISKDSIKKLIQELETGYDILYFYYRGHGDGFGRMGTGQSIDEFYSYDEFAEDLLSTQALDLNIILDCSYSGQVYQAFEDNSLSCFKNIEISTSTSEEKSSFTFFNDPNPDGYGYGIYSYIYEMCNRDFLADIDLDGRVTPSETGKWIEALDPSDVFDEKPSIYQCPQYSSRTFLRDFINGEIKSHFTTSLGEELLNRSDIYFNPLLTNGVNIKQTNGDPLLSYAEPSLGVVDLDKGLFFPKNTIFYKILMDENCEEVSIEEVTVPKSDVPTVKDNSGQTINPYENKIRSGSFDIFPLEPIELEPYEVPPPPNGKGVLFLTGYDPRPDYEDMHMKNVHHWFLQEFLFDKYGPGIPESQSNELRAPSIEQFCSVVEGLKNKYDNHFYFCYLGSGTRQNELRLGPKDNDVISLLELWQKLAIFKADTMTIILDGGITSDSLIEILLTTDLKKKGVVYVQTSDTGDEPVRLVFSQDGSQVQTTLTNKLLLPMNSSLEADLDADERIGLVESFFYSQKTADDPKYEIGFVLHNSSNGFGFGIHPWSSIEVNSELLQLTGMYSWKKPLTEEDLKDELYYPLGTNWVASQVTKMSDDYRNCPLLDFRYKVNPALVDLEAGEGILALISRKSPDTQWEVIPDQNYDSEEMVFTITNHEICGEYQLAKVRDNSSTVTDINESQIDLEIQPNIIRNTLNVQLSNIMAGQIMVNVVDITGQILLTETQILSGANEVTFTLEVGDFHSGTYFLQLIDEKRMSKVKAFVKQ